MSDEKVFPKIIYVWEDEYYSRGETGADQFLASAELKSTPISPEPENSSEAELVATYKLIKVQRKSVKVILEDI